MDVEVTQPIQPSTPCRLLDLPAELLTEILTLLVIQPQDPFPPPPHLSPASSPPRRFCASVLKTCHRFYALGNPILYGSNIFSAHTSLLSSHPSFLLQIQPHRVTLPPLRYPRLIPLIKRFHILVRLDTDPRFTAAQVTAAFTAVQELEIEVFQSMYDSCDYAVLGLFEGVRGVGRARVGGSVGDREYAGWLEGMMMAPVGVQGEGWGGARGRCLGWEGGSGVVDKGVV